MIRYSQHHRVADVIKYISAGKIQVPEFMSNQFYWGEGEIVTFLENYYSGLYIPNILLITPGSGFSSFVRLTQPQPPDFEIPARRLSRNISKTGIKHPADKPVNKPDHESIYYIVDGYHRLQSLYLAWHGMFDRKHIYFNIGALTVPRFCFLTSAENKLKNYSRLSKAKDIFIENPVAFMDQINKNCKWFKKIFYDTSRMYIDIIDMNHSLFNEYFWQSFDYNPKMKILSDRLKFIRDNYMTPPATT